MTSVYVVVAVAALIIALLFYVDQRVKYGRYSGKYREKPTFWSLGERKNHPIWAWLVSAILWFILAATGFGTIHYMLFGHHGPHLASKIGLEKHETKEIEGGILKEVTHGGKLEKHRHFHNLVEITTLQDKNPICYFCHGNFPHKRRRFIRTLMNMHTQFIGCFTCHVSTEEIDEKSITFRWYNYSDNRPKGRPFGLAYDEKTGQLEQTDDYYSKIIGFITVKGEEKMLEIPEDSPIALEYLSIRDQLAKDVELQGKFKNRVHKNVMPRGRFCTRCHTSEEESMIPFRKLGFSDERINDLTGLNIVGIVQKYKRFYIPTLYRGQDKESKEIIRTLVGEEGEKAEMKEPTAPVFDPRAWWRQNYMPKEKTPEKVWKK